MFLPPNNPTSKAVSSDVFRPQVFASSRAFAAVRHDGSVVTWGDEACGGDSSPSAGFGPRRRRTWQDRGARPDGEIMLRPGGNMKLGGQGDGWRRGCKVQVKIA